MCAVNSLARTHAAVLAALIATGCSTTIMLTEPGSHVQNVSQADAPFGCELLGDVAIGIPPDAGRPRTEDQLVILMRNKAGEIGATHVVVDMHEQRTGNGGEIYFVGRGRAYACSETHDETTPVVSTPVDQTEGGESAPAEDEEAPPED